MANPNFIPGPLNRLLGSIIWDDFTSLNVTPSFLLPEGIDFTPSGPFTTNLPSLTSVVPSPEPYVPVEVMIHIIRTSPLAAAFKVQMEASTFLGGCTLRSDAITLGAYTLVNMSITKLERMMFNGKDAGHVVTVAGSYPINQNLWT